MKRGPQPKLRPVDIYEMRINREAGIPINDCAKMAGVSRATALKYLAELRRKLGPEKLPNERRARSYLGRLPETTNS